MKSCFKPFCTREISIGRRTERVELWIASLASIAQVCARRSITEAISDCNLHLSHGRIAFQACPASDRQVRAVQ